MKKQMTDPHEGLVRFQQAYNDGLIAPRACALHKELCVLNDEPTPGSPRLTYSLIKDGQVKATVVYVMDDPYQGLPCFGVGYAVALPYRKQGLAAIVLEKSIDEMRHGFRKLIPKFYIEAIVGVNNVASQKVAARVLSQTPISITDQVSNQPALQYFKLIENQAG